MHIHTKSEILPGVNRVFLDDTIIDIITYHFPLVPFSFLFSPIYLTPPKKNEKKKGSLISPTLTTTKLFSVSFSFLYDVCMNVWCVNVSMISDDLFRSYL